MSVVPSLTVSESANNEVNTSNLSKNLPETREGRRFRVEMRGFCRISGVTEIGEEITLWYAKQEMTHRCNKHIFRKRSTTAASKALRTSRHRQPNTNVHRVRMEVALSGLNLC